MAGERVKLVVRSRAILGYAEGVPLGEQAQAREFDFIELDPYDFGIVTTQTCDLNEEGTPMQPWFHACPVYRYDEGSRLDPTVARVHFIGRGPLEDDLREKLETWWPVA